MAHPGRSGVQRDVQLAQPRLIEHQVHQGHHGDGDAARRDGLGEAAELLDEDQPASQCDRQDQQGAVAGEAD